MDKFYSKSLDDLAKNAFEKEAEDTMGDAASWSKMHQLLDQELPQKRKRRPVVFWFFIFLLAGLFMTGASRFLVDKKQNNKLGNFKTDHAIKTQIISDERPLNKPNLDAVKLNNKSNKLIIKLPNTFTLSNKKIIAHSNIKKEENISNEKTERKTDENPNMPPKRNFTNKGMLVNVEEINNKDNLKKLEQKENQKIDLVNQEKAEEKNNSSLSHLDLIKTNDTIKEPIINKLSEKKTSKWEWNLTLAPDFLLANMQPLHQPGFIMGVGINYLLSPKWRIRSGLLYNYSTIDASGDGYLYKPSPNLPSYTSLELRNVKGSLHVFEVPLSLRYTAQPNKNWSFISSVGLSSLFFMKQQYTYDLLLNGSTPLLWNSANDTDDDGESHILNNLNIGAGISVKTKRNMVLEIEPIFKLPLEELGEGHNKLGTIALYFNLRMPINKKKK